MEKCGSFKESLLVANFLLSNGFPTNRRILELSDNNKGETCVSSILAKNCNCDYTLLSKNFDKEIAQTNSIKGTRGTLFSPFGYVSIKSDSKYEEPLISDFDTIIVNGNYKNLLLLPALSQDIYASYVLDINNHNLEELRSVYSLLYHLISLKSKKGYMMINEQNKKYNREYCLIRKK